MAKLLELVYDENDDIVSDALEAISKLAKAFPEECPKDSKFIKRLSFISKNGKMKQAKHAAIILVYGNFNNECELILKEITNDLIVEEDMLLTYFSTVYQMTKQLPDVYYRYHDRMLTCITDILLKNETSQEQMSDDWVEFEDLDQFGKLKVGFFRVILDYWPQDSRS
jgi:hypothetical protein